MCFEEIKAISYSASGCLSSGTISIEAETNKLEENRKKIRKVKLLLQDKGLISKILEILKEAFLFPIPKTNEDLLLKQPKS